MNKKLIGITLGLIAFSVITPVKWQTTGDFQITINPETLEISVLMTGSTTTGTTNTGTMINTVTTGTEFQQALAWMYANGLTMYNNEFDYRPDDGLLREEAAKIIWQAFTVLGYAQTTKNTVCTFSDSAQIDPTLTNHVQNTCKRGIFKGTTDGKFLPREQLTRPQSMALLIRIFEGKLSNENTIPRRGEYYLKGQAIGLTTLNNQVAFDSMITRKEMAIYIRRLKNIVTNETLKLMMLGKIAEIQNKETTPSTGLLNSFAWLSDSLSINNDPELQEAIRRMNDNWLTIHKTIPTYQPFDILNREQAAKLLTTFAELFGFANTTTNINCLFQDIQTAETSLVPFIEKACKMGIMQWSQWRFWPKNNINKSEFVAAIIRLFEWKKLDETKNPRRKSYFEKAQELGMIWPADAITFDNPITRYEVALFLYRFKIKFQMLQNINNNTIQNQIISTVPWSILTGTNNLPESRVYVDINLLRNSNFDVGYIEIFTNRYKIVKARTEKYFTNNFVWYGDVFSINTEEKIGTISYIVSNLSLVEGTIRINDSTYIIEPILNTNAYYKLNQTK